MLKAAVTSEPALALPDQNWQFELETNALNTATEAILYQREPHPDDTTDKDRYPILKGKQCALGYYSHGLTPTERNYPIYDKEYLGVLHGLHHWRYLLTNTPPKLPILIITKHANL